ncbi:hypothetical protein ZIOFF_012852 [Zingiber officinale]|uniref:Uncharacterized protein n=1 Tax=Zingiber officinale TaxID=94328 RepID=A0A8J5LLU4_ZINOF|nr:hypothetical protein ZIOFF_012852 [Zingiber officinale]
MTSKRKVLPRIPRRSSFHNVPAAVYAVLYAKQKQVVIIPDSSKASEITNSPSSNLMELGNPSSVAPVPDSSATSEALEVPMSPWPNLMELGNPRCVHLADELNIQLNQNPCLKSIPNHGKLYEFVAMKHHTSRSDIVSCNSCSTESNYDSSMSSESFDVQTELQELREEHGEELSTVGDI